MVLVALIAVAQASLTVEFSSTPLPIALDKLSKATGIQLKAKPVLADEVLLIHLEQAPIGPTLEHIAQSLVAKWETQSDGSLLLVPDQHEKQKRRAEKDRREWKRLLNSLVYVKNRLAEQPNELTAEFVQQTKRQKALEEARRKKAEENNDYSGMFVASTSVEQEPAWRACAAILLSMDPKELFAMQNDEVRVFSDQPTQMQVRFSGAVGQILAKYKSELKLTQPTSELARVRMKIVRWETTASYNVSFDGLEQSGKVIDSGFVRMNDDSVRMKARSDERDKNPLATKEEPIQLPQEVQDARLAYASLDDSRNVTPEMRLRQTQILPLWTERALDPVKWEPTQWDMAAQYLAAARRLHQNLVGTVPEITSYVYRLTGSPVHLPTPSQVLHESSIIKRLNDGFVVTYSDDESERISRYKGRQWLRSCAKAGGLTFDVASEIVAGSTSRYPFINWWGDLLRVQFPSNGPHSPLGLMMSEETLWLWGSLSPANRQNLREGRTINLSSIPNEAKSLIHRCVFWRSGLDVKGDPTELLPNGIDGATLQLRIDESTVFQAWNSKDPTDKPSSFAPADFGRGLGKGNSYWERSAAWYSAKDRFKLGTERNYQIVVMLQPGNIPMTLDAAEVLFPEKTALTELPSDIRAAVEKAKETALKQSDESKPDSKPNVDP